MLTIFSFSRYLTVVKKIDLESIDVVYAYRKCGVDGDQTGSHHDGGLIGKLKDGRFFKLVGNEFYTDYDCGAIWLTNKFCHLMYVDEKDVNVSHNKNL